MEIFISTSGIFDSFGYETGTLNNKTTVLLMLPSSLQPMLANNPEIPSSAINTHPWAYFIWCYRPYRKEWLAFITKIVQKKRLAREAVSYSVLREALEKFLLDMLADDPERYRLTLEHVARTHPDYIGRAPLFVQQLKQFRRAEKGTFNRSMSIQDFVGMFPRLAKALIKGL